MIRFIGFTWGLAGAWAWLLFTDGGRDAGVLGYGAVLGATLGLFVFMVRRSNRLSGGGEYVNARLEYHQGFSKARWKRNKPARGDDGGSEFSIGRGF